MSEKKRITTASAKAKARRLQNWVSAMIAAVTGLPWGKDEYIAPREMGQSGVDVRLVGPARVAFPFSVECKAQETWSVHAWIDQAEENQLPGTDWLLFCRRSQKNGLSGRTVVIMDAEAFFRLRGMQPLKRTK